MWPQGNPRCVQPGPGTGRILGKGKSMSNVLPIDGDAYRAAMAWSVLRRIRRRQDELRRRWYELSREEVETELAAIGQELVEAAPLFLPGSFDSGGKTGSSNNDKALPRNGHYRLQAEHADLHPATVSPDFSEAQPRPGKEPEVRSWEDERLEALINRGERLLDELNRLVKELEGRAPESEAPS